MFTFDHIVLSLLANAIGLFVVILMKSAPPRITLYVSLASMLAILVPWISLGKSLKEAVPLADFPGSESFSLGLANASTIASDSFNFYLLVVITWLTVGIVWIAITVWRSVETKSQWRKIAHHEPSLLRLAPASLAGRIPDAKIWRLPDSTEVATTGLWNHEIWVGDRIDCPEQLRAALTHEFCHLVEHDQIKLLIIVIIERLLWWNPLVWVLGKRARRSMEFHCDSLSMSLIGRNEYQRSLAQLFLLDSSTKFAHELSIGFKSDVVKRMENLNMTHQYKLSHLLILASAGILITSASIAAGEADSSVPMSSIVECHKLLPDNVQYEFKVITDVDTREGQSNEMRVEILDLANPDSTDWPEEASGFIACIQAPLGIGDDEGWPGT